MDEQSLSGVFRHRKTYAKAYVYPCGIVDILASTDADFGPKGLESAEDYSRPQPLKGKVHKHADPDADASGQRAMRRARARVRRLALANDFKWFVTLTLDPAKVDRCSGEDVVKKLNAWCSNMVQRKGLKYILVPEYHKKGGIHFHGFFSADLDAVDSGTVRVPWAKKPRRPHNKKEREEWIAAGGQIVYNLPAWTLGYTTAMELYGEYPAAVSYVCKYIGKDGVKPAGRWYYSGGQLNEPQAVYFDTSPRALMEEYGDKCLLLQLPGKHMAVVNGIEGGVENVRERG